jgi:p-hydroxybenzoate 3-monooxygenase
MRTQVGIVGAGPAGLLLARLLELAGIDSIVIEACSQHYIEHRVRAGVLEQSTVRALSGAGAGERLLREGLVQAGLELRVNGRRHRIALSDLTGGRTTTVYGQEQIVKDLIAARLAGDGPLLFGARATRIHDCGSACPVIEFRHRGADRELRCDVVAGCDGFHGVSRAAIPRTARVTYTRSYRLAWLAVLAAAPPSAEELVYAPGSRGLALHNARGRDLSRMHLQCDPRDDVAAWTDDRIWAEAEARLSTDDDWMLNQGEILKKEIVTLRSLVTEPMRYGRLFLAGDAAHIVPPTGAKGLNLAVADAEVLAEALTAWYGSGDERLLDAYSATCLRRVWRVQRFASWMTWLLHRAPGQDGYGERERLAELDRLCSSPVAAAAMAEEFVGSATSATRAGRAGGQP